jgi:hypothetical protein
MGYTHITAPHAAAIAVFYQEHLNPYLNFHRPCGVPELVVNAKGKEKRRYRWYATPWEILRQLPDVARHLKADVTIAMLDQLAQAKSDTQAAEEMQEAKCKLFESFRGSSPAVCLPSGNAVLRTKTKTSLEGKPKRSGTADRLPLVGLGTRKPNQERRP